MKDCNQWKEETKVGIALLREIFQTFHNLVVKSESNLLMVDDSVVHEYLHAQEEKQIHETKQYKLMEK